MWYCKIMWYVLRLSKIQWHYIFCGIVKLVFMTMPSKRLNYFLKTFLDLIQSSKMCHLLICHSSALHDQCSECALIFNKMKVISVKLAIQWRENNMVIGYIFHFLLHLLHPEHMFAYLRVHVFSDLAHLLLSFLCRFHTNTKSSSGSFISDS